MGNSHDKSKPAPGWETYEADRDPGPDGYQRPFKFVRTTEETWEHAERDAQIFVDEAVRKRKEDVEDSPPIVCPRCGGAEDLCDNLGDGEHALCLRCGLCWVPSGHAEPWPCPVCLVGSAIAHERVRAALRDPSAEHRRKMFAAAVFLGEPACTEIRKLLAQLEKIDVAMERTDSAFVLRLIDDAIVACAQGRIRIEDLKAIREAIGNERNPTA